MASRTDQDSPWKEILPQYFPEAIAFFFPDLHRLIDWQKSIEFLNKEFQQIAPDTETEQTIRGSAGQSLAQTGQGTVFTAAYRGASETRSQFR